MEKSDLVIVGGGPAGSACALLLANSGLRITLLEKAKFPRDKICGDALSVDVINQLPLLSQNLARAFDHYPYKISSFGARIFSPDHHSIDIPFFYKGQPKNGFICSRLHFDNLLFQELKANDNIRVVENCEVKEVHRDKDEIKIYTTLGVFAATMIIGADGANSAVKRCLSDSAIIKSQHSGGMRMYFEGVTSFHPENFIELHFLKETLPGYIWIFPMEGNKANTGITILSSKISSKKINLRETFKKAISENEYLKNRFVNASPLETPKGFGLPLGSNKKALSGDRFLLAGDAAGLIDPFTGEGIGNSIRSGRVAAAHVLNCFNETNFSGRFNLNYDREIYRRIGNEFIISRNLLRIANSPVLINLIVKKAAGSKYWQNFLTEAMADINEKKKIGGIKFLMNLLFR